MITFFGVSLALVFVGAALVVWWRGVSWVRGLLGEIAFLNSEVAALRIMNKVMHGTAEEQGAVIGCLRSALADSQAEVARLRQSTPAHGAAIAARENNWRLN